MISDSRHADELLTAERIAEELGAGGYRVTPERIYRWHRDGTRNDATGERVRLRAIRLPRRLMYRRGDLEEFIAALQPPEEQQAAAPGREVHR